MAGTDLKALLDRQRQRQRQRPGPVPDAPAAGTAIGVDCDLPGAVRWDLARPQVGVAVLDELRHRVEALARQINGVGR